MAITRRQFLVFMGGAAGVAACRSFSGRPSNALAFQPVQLPLPLKVGNVAAKDQMQIYRTYEVMDDLVIPAGYRYSVLAAWGDPVGDSRFGYNNDFVSLVEAETGSFLAVNFEYVSGKTWMQTYAEVIGKSLPLVEVKEALAQRGGEINAFSLPPNDPLKQKIEAIAKEGLIDQGIGVLGVKNDNGTWERTPGQQDRRITGISGLEDEHYLAATGAAVAVFEKTRKLGYDDQLQARIIGTFQNCAGGTTPWGTILSAEENFQEQVPEPVMADGSSMKPDSTPFVLTDQKVDGRGNPFGLAGNKYGWMVEVDPANAQDYGTKHTWLGRYRHEAVAVRAVKGKKLAVYSGCDRRGGHLYKFVSQDKISNVTDQQNSRLLAAGMLYGAQLNPDGTGQWIALNPDTAVNPVLPSQVLGKDGQGLVTFPNPDRQVGGMVEMTQDADAIALQKQFKTLGDLYVGNATEKQGAILIDAHFAANAAGVTCMARPEDTTVNDQGTLFIAFTSGSPGGDGGPDKQIFTGPEGEAPYEFGWIMKLEEDQRDPSAMTFRWELIALGGEPADGGLGFSNPDNLAVDGNGNLWMVTDISTSKHNQAVPSRTEDGETLDSSKLRGVFGNNSAWFIPLNGPQAGQAQPFAIGPMECELCGLCLSSDQQSLFLAVQHPGEVGGMRKERAAETRQLVMQTTDGQAFTQTRQVPLGSNWPGKTPKDPPKPALVVVQREDGQTLT